MDKLSFEIKDSFGFYKKLVDDYNEFCSLQTSARVALNCAMTAWHLTEWFYHENLAAVKSQFPKLGLFQQHFKDLCPELQIMHDIANGTKHCVLTRHKTAINSTNLKAGAFGNGFSSAFNVSVLEINLNDGRKMCFSDAIESVVVFWSEKFPTS